LAATPPLILAVRRKCMEGMENISGTPKVSRPRRNFYEWLNGQKILRDETIKCLFDHFRNIGIAALLMAGGIYWQKNPTNDPEFIQISGFIFGLIGGLLLFTFNFMHGLKRLGDAGLPSKLLLLLGACLYVPMVSLLTALLHGR
jgi:hypothetical protein